MRRIMIKIRWGGKSPLICFFILFASLCAIGNEYKFSLMPLRCSFYGSVIDFPNIIVYGEFGTYLLSSDFGKTWSQNFIGKYSTIRDIKKSKDTLFGVLEDGYIIYSTNKGKNWNIVKPELEYDEKFYKLLVTEDNIFIRGSETVTKLTKDFNVVKTLRDSLLKLTPYMFDDEFSLQKKLTYFDVFFDFAFDKIVLSKPYWDKPGSFYALDLNLNELKIIDLKGKVKESPYTSNYNLENFFRLGTKTALKINYNLYVPDTALTNYKYFFKDTTFLDMENLDLNVRKRVFSLLTENTYLEINDSLFGSLLYAYTIPGDKPETKIFLYDKIDFKKYYDSPQDTFIQVGRPLANYYYTNIDVVSQYGYEIQSFPTINSKMRRRKISNFKDEIYVFSEDRDATFPPTQKKFLLLAKDYFSSWDLVSVLDGEPIYILNDTVFFFVRKNEIFRTFDGGVTFKPLEFYVPGDDTLAKYLYHYPAKLFNYYIKSMFVDSSGQGVVLFDKKNDVCTITKNFFKTVNSYYSMKSIDNATGQFPSNIEKLSNYFVFSFSDTTRKPFKYDIFLTDTNWLYFNKMSSDTGFAIFNILVDYNINSFIAFGLANNSQNKNQWHLEIRQTNDSGRTFKVINQINEKIYLNNFYQHNKDSVFFTTSLPDRLYLFDRKTNELKLLWEAEEGDFRPLLMVISDRFYLVGRGLFLENADRSDLTQWREGEWDYGKPNFESVIFRGNVAIAGLSDSLRPFNYYKITLKKQEPSIVKEPTVEKRYYTTHFWASDPYPQPAKVRVKARVAWDGSFDLREAIDGVYDTMGRKVEGKERIRVDARNTTSGELEWECSGVPAGIYFILIRWRGGSETVPVVVE